ncbi:MAG: LuxR C-terminal-related transcriptional regulator, partial [Treponema sp.]|nr:LuxR C-terminal-related transcriptional regulator [Treponema sp.]
RPEKEAESQEVADGQRPSTGSKPLPALFRRAYLFPILATLVIFWTNSFTDRLFFPILNIHFPPGFHPVALVPIVAVTVFCFLSCFSPRRFLIIFIPLCSFLFLLGPSLLFFSHSNLLFLVLYMLNITARQMITVVFPFVIVDLYLNEVKRSGRRGHWAWLLAASIHLIQTNALILNGPFRALSIDNGYAVVLLSLTGFVFYFLSIKGIGNMEAVLPPVIPYGAIPLKSLEENFKERGLSEREAEVALLMAHEGLSNKEMGERLCISPLTIRDHVTSVYRKFDVKGRVEFMAKVFNNEQ